MPQEVSASNLAAPASVPVVRLDGGVVCHDRDELAGEEPLEIRVRGRAISVTMRTPGEPGDATQDAELAAGFLLTEGVIRSVADIDLIEPCARNEHGNSINVRLAPLVHVDFDRLTRHVFASSSCGLCGKAAIDAVRTDCSPITSDVSIPAALLAQLPRSMRKAQPAFDRTGGLHAAALFSERGDLIVVREDIGRHNAVDKVVGRALLAGLVPLSRAILIVSGRSSFEIMQKSAAAGIPIVAAVSAPSSLAVQFAQEAGQTLVGFLRESRMNIYTRPERIVVS